MSQIIKNSSTGGVGAFEFAMPPAITDDFNSGFLVGDRWIDTITKLEYVLIEGTVGNAIWKKTTEFEDDGVGGLTLNSNVTFNGGLILGEALTINMNSHQDNFVIPNIETAILIRINCTGNNTLTGIVPNNITTACMKYIVNVGTGTITVKDNDSGSNPNNRILFGANRNLQSNEGFIMFYDPISLRWRGASIIN